VEFCLSHIFEAMRVRSLQCVLKTHSARAEWGLRSPVLILLLCSRHSICQRDVKDVIGMRVKNELSPGSSKTSKISKVGSASTQSALVKSLA
jgi:hypothetical protein